MTHKQYLRKVEKLEREGDEEGLATLERERMDDLDSFGHRFHKCYG